MKRARTPEGGLLRACLQRLAMEGMSWCGWRQNAGLAFRGQAPIKLAPAGVADIIGAWRGRPLAVECKAGKTRPDVARAQAAFADAWATAGGTYLRVTDVEALGEWLRNASPRVGTDFLVARGRGGG